VPEYESISLSSKCGPFADNPWIGASWTINNPWPKHACIQRYDAEPDASGIIRISVSNGSALYRVVRQNTYGGSDALSYDCELIESA
jgi:hypothetical protein